VKLTAFGDPAAPRNHGPFVHARRKARNGSALPQLGTGKCGTAAGGRRRATLTRRACLLGGLCHFVREPARRGSRPVSFWRQVREWS
jgi:hypothetical protein